MSAANLPRPPFPPWCPPGQEHSVMPTSAPAAAPTTTLASGGGSGLILPGPHNVPGYQSNVYRHHIIKWNTRHQLLLYMDVSGKYTLAELAEKVGYHPDRVNAIRASPLYKAQRDALYAEIHAGTLTDLKEMIRHAAPQNFRFLERMRDDSTTHLDDPKARLGAAMTIERAVDRVYPKITRTEVDHTVRLEIGERAAELMKRALDEDGKRQLTSEGAIPVDFVPVGEEISELDDEDEDEADNQPEGMKSLDDYAAELRAAEADPETDRDD